MSSPASSIVPTDLSQTTTLAIILGAAAFPKTTLSAPPSFANSAKRFRDYLTGDEGFGLPLDNILDLFDTDFSPDQIQEQIALWLERRRAALGKEGKKPRDLIFYYVGHGSFSSPDQQYILAIRNTKKNFEGVSSVKMIDLGSTLSEAALDLRRYLILDCCFAGAAVKSLMGPVNDLVHQKTIEAFPRSGTTLLCASDAHDAAEAPSELPETVFSGTMLSILAEGDRTIETGLSMSALGVRVRKRIPEMFKNYKGLPEVHTPVQDEGNIAAIPLFPNAANRPRTLTEQIGQLNVRMTLIEQQLKEQLGATATASDVAVLKTRIEELAGSVVGIKTAASDSLSPKSQEQTPQESELWNTMPSWLRIQLRFYRIARLNGLVWVGTAFVLFGLLMIGYTWDVRILGLRYMYNPFFWFVVLCLLLSGASFRGSVSTAVPYPSPPEISEWTRLGPVLAASTTLIRRTFFGIEIANTLLITATLVYVIAILLPILHSALVSR